MLETSWAPNLQLLPLTINLLRLLLLLPEDFLDLGGKAVPNRLLGRIRLGRRGQSSDAGVYSLMDIDERGASWEWLAEIWRRLEEHAARWEVVARFGVRHCGEIGSVDSELVWRGEGISVMILCVLRDKVRLRVVLLAGAVRRERLTREGYDNFVALLLLW
jgi:hypothetical protein